MSSDVYSNVLSQNLADEEFKNGKNSLVFAIDCSEEMFSLVKKNQTHFNHILNSVYEIYLNKIIAVDNDLKAVILFGTEISENSKSFQGINSFLKLSQASIDSIKKLKKLKDISCESFQEEFGIDSDFELSDVLEECLNMFQEAQHKIDKKTVILFTWKNDPCPDDVISATRAKSKSKDLSDNNINFHVSSPNPDFTIEEFYKEIISDSSSYNVLSKSINHSFHLYNSINNIYTKMESQFRFPLILGTFEIFVGAYKRTRHIEKQFVKVDEKTHKIIEKKMHLIDSEGVQLSNHPEMNYFQIWGGKEVVFKNEEIKELRNFVKKGLRVLGFKPQSQIIRRFYHIKPSLFIYPNDDVVKGCRIFFQALLQKCAQKGVVAVCSFKPSDNTQPSLVYLLPQLEKSDEDLGTQKAPPGFHLIYLPFADDIRQIEMIENETSPSEEEVKLAEKIVEKMTFSYNPLHFKNPSLQIQQKYLEALICKESQSIDVTDDSAPDYDRINEEVGSLLESFEQLLPASSSKRSKNHQNSNDAKKKKEFLEIDVNEYVLSNKLSTLTVAVLKDICFKLGIRCPSRKNEIISRIQDYYLRKMESQEAKTSEDQTRS